MPPVGPASAWLQYGRLAAHEDAGAIENWAVEGWPIEDRTRAASLALIRSIFFYPYNARAVHEPGIEEPFCACIRHNYVIEQSSTPDHSG